MHVFDAALVKPALTVLRQAVVRAAASARDAPYAPGTTAPAYLDGSLPGDFGAGLRAFVSWIGLQPGRGTGRAHPAATPRQPRVACPAVVAPRARRGPPLRLVAWRLQMLC